jgi:hypothetical protein
MAMSLVTTGFDGGRLDGDGFDSVRLSSGKLRKNGFDGVRLGGIRRGGAGLGAFGLTAVGLVMGLMTTLRSRSSHLRSVERAEQEISWGSFFCLLIVVTGLDSRVHRFIGDEAELSHPLASVR